MFRLGQTPKTKARDEYGRVRKSTEKYGNLSFRLGETDVLVRTSTEECGIGFYGTSRKLQAAGQRLQATSYRLQAASCSYRLQATGYKLQAAGCKLQATGDRLQASSYRLQAAGYKLQAASYKTLYWGPVR